MAYTAKASASTLRKGLHWPLVHITGNYSLTEILGRNKKTSSLVITKTKQNINAETITESNSKLSMLIIVFITIISCIKIDKIKAIYNTGSETRHLKTPPTSTTL